MTPSPDKNLSPQEVKFEDAHLKKIFLECLSSIYCGKEHFVNFFGEIKTLATLEY